MIRKILSFAVLALVALIVFKIAFGLLGLFIGVGVSILVLAVFGYLFFLVLRVVSPQTAARVQDAIRGRPASGQHS